MAYRRSVLPVPRRGNRPKISFSELTLGERIVMITWTASAGLLPLGGVALAVASPGTGRALGIVLLLIGLVAAAVPMRPVLGPRIERRLQASRPER